MDATRTVLNEAPHANGATGRWRIRQSACGPVSGLADGPRRDARGAGQHRLPGQSSSGVGCALRPLTVAGAAQASRFRYSLFLPGMAVRVAYDGYTTQQRRPTPVAHLFPVQPWGENRLRAPANRANEGAARIIPLSRDHGVAYPCGVPSPQPCVPLACHRRFLPAPFVPFAPSSHSRPPPPTI